MPPVLAACPNTEPVLLEPKPAKKRKENKPPELLLAYKTIQGSDTNPEQGKDRSLMPKHRDTNDVTITIHHDVPRLDKFKIYANTQIINSIESLFESHSPFLFGQPKNKQKIKGLFTCGIVANIRELDFC